MGLGDGSGGLGVGSLLGKRRRGLGGQLKEVVLLGVECLQSAGTLAAYTLATHSSEGLHPCSLQAPLQPTPLQPAAWGGRGVVGWGGVAK